MRGALRKNESHMGEKRDLHLLLKLRKGFWNVPNCGKDKKREQVGNEKDRPTKGGGTRSRTLRGGSQAQREKKGTVEKKKKKRPFPWP